MKVVVVICAVLVVVVFGVLGKGPLTGACPKRGLCSFGLPPVPGSARLAQLNPLPIWLAGIVVVRAQIRPASHDVRLPLSRVVLMMDPLHGWVVGINTVGVVGYAHYHTPRPRPRALCPAAGWPPQPALQH